MASYGLSKSSVLRNVLILAACTASTAGLTSCDHKELCLDHWDHALRYSVDYHMDWQREWQYTYEGGTDWQALWNQYGFGFDYDDMRPQTPSGIRVQVYTDGHGNEVSNIPADGGVVNMTPGEHQVLFYNNDTEYIVFNDISSSVQATATTRSRSRATYIGNSMMNNQQSENTINPPDFLFGHYVKSYSAEKTQVAPAVNITMKPLVFRYIVRYRFSHGLKYVALGRGALAGMAASVYLTDGHTGSDVATVLYDCEIKPWGVEATVNTFGVPNYPNPEYTRAAGRFGVNLEVRLTNGRMLSFDFDITGQMLRQPRGGVIEVGGIDIPDELGKEDSGTFDVDVGGWGDYEDVVIDFGNIK